MCSVCSDTPIDTAHDSGQHGITLAGSEVNFHPAGGIDSAESGEGADAPTSRSYTSAFFLLLFFSFHFCACIVRGARLRGSLPLCEMRSAAWEYVERERKHIIINMLEDSFLSPPLSLPFSPPLHPPPPPLPLPLPFPSASDGLERQRKTSVTSAQETR